MGFSPFGQTLGMCLTKRVNYKEVLPPWTLTVRLTNPFYLICLATSTWTWPSRTTLHLILGLFFRALLLYLRPWPFYIFFDFLGLFHMQVLISLIVFVFDLILFTCTKHNPQNNLKREPYSYFSNNSRCI